MKTNTYYKPAHQQPWTIEQSMALGLLAVNNFRGSSDIRGAIGE